MKKYIIVKDRGYSTIIEHDCKNDTYITVIDVNDRKENRIVNYPNEIIDKVMYIKEESTLNLDGKVLELKCGDCVMLFRKFQSKDLIPIIINNETNSTITSAISDYFNSMEKRQEEHTSEDNSNSKN